MASAIQFREGFGSLGDSYVPHPPYISQSDEDSRTFIWPKYNTNYPYDYKIQGKL